MNLIYFGEIVWDVYDNKSCLGGAPLNFAAYVAMLGEKAYLASAVGDDELGREAIKNLEQFAVDSEYVSVLSDKETGKCMVTLNQNGVPEYEILDDTAYDYIQMPEFGVENDIIAFGTLALRNVNNKNVLKQILQKYTFREVFSDLNIRSPFYSDESIEFCLKNATIVKISDEEMPAIQKAVDDNSESAEKFVLNLCEKFNQIRIVIITLGENGAFCFNCKEDKFYYCKAQATNVMSTVGAGDSFGAAFLTEFFQSGDCQASLEFATKVSSVVCSRQEAISEEIHTLISRLIIET